MKKRIMMDAEQRMQMVVKGLSKSVPQVFEEIRHGARIGFMSYRQFDAALQRAKKAGLVLYLSKSNGGPGWVRK